MGIVLGVLSGAACGSDEAGTAPTPDPSGGAGTGGAGGAGGSGGDAEPTCTDQDGDYYIAESHADPTDACPAVCGPTHDEVCQLPDESLG